MKSKKFIILPICFILSFTLHSQDDKQYAKVNVSYAAQIKMDKESAVYKTIEQYMPGRSKRVENVAPELSLSLVFNDSISLFFAEKKLFSDTGAAQSAFTKIGYYGRIKQQPYEYITEELQEDFGKFLVSRPYQDWELHDESKIIGEYTCFKATTFLTTTNPDGKVFKHNFTAWYTPQLPYKFGPLGYGNLPGLVIELQGKEFTMGVSQIKFYEPGLQNKENKMPRLKKLKTITGEEFEKRAAEDEKRWREQRN